MDLSFTTVSYDGELEDLSEDELRTLVSEYEDAQDSNAAEFEKAAEETDEITEEVEEFEEARQALIGEITESENFEDVPLTEQELEDKTFGQLREWSEFVQTGGSEATEDEPKNDEQTDFGTKSPKITGDGTEDFVEDELSGMPGVNL